MASGAAIDSRPSSSLGIGRHVRSNASAAQKVDKVLGVIALIGPQSFHPEPFSPLTFEHALGRLPLRAPGGLTDFKINQKPVMVLPL